MTATFTVDVFSSLDGYGAAGGDWTGYWGKQGPNCWRTAKAGVIVKGRTLHRG